MKRFGWIAALLFAVGGVARADALLINGAGATFPFPLYSKWFAAYNKLHPELRFNYQSIGSGGGVKQITEKTVDFGASDSPMSDAELQKAPGVLHVPTVLGAVVVVYNGAPAGMKLTPELLADIFLGKLTRWNDPKLQALPGQPKLPDAAITVVHRSDGSGTTAVFTDYLAKVSPQWKTQVGAAKAVKWPVGLGGKGNEGVTGSVKSTPGAIGYVELAYANQNQLAMASLKNADGNFVTASIETTSEAAAGVTMPADFRVSITNARGKNAYPIASFTYVLIYKEQADAAKGKAIGQFLWWAIHDGQKLAAPLDYAPLPKAVVAKVEHELRGITVAGKSVIASN
ncbi:MAG TPA: phosphate ABC transporter substrate-binding protein PstS [Polyangia bacterium]|jgi:phosphate transport system substrate-binding protein|nr:phosphate ABC transporter substrate-binding protein PstS [Polyangia bacterium]